MDGAFAAARKHPADAEKTQKDKPDEKVITMFVNQGIQEPGRTREIIYRVFHTTPSGLFTFIS
jgi:hypothetical protein